MPARLRPLALTVLLAGATAWSARAQIPVKPAPAQLSPLVVTASRAPQDPVETASAVRVLDAATLRGTPAATVDGVLRGVPAFSLFRRNDSFTANPTAQGVSLRGLGPSGASRSLVLLDGVPLNDPFGGWVTWSKLPREGLARAELVPGGGATAWGQAALGGVVQLFTLPLEAAPATPAALGGRVALTAGDFGTRSAEFAVTAPAGRGAVQFLGRAFATDGFTLVAPERRGPVDLAAWSRHRWLTARWRQPLAADDRLALTATVRGFEENRGNGTAYQRNASREKFASLQLDGRPADGFTWTATGYAQDQSFASTFGSVNAARTAETPASDQFSVPATAFGAAWTGLLRHADGARTSFGADARAVRGETREHFTFLAGTFTRLRVAGGSQGDAGVFALHDRPLADGLRATAGARLDAWRESSGHRRESDRMTAVASRDDRYADRDGTAFSPSAGLVWTPAPAWRVRTNAQHAFRRPTLNELYRPFRQGANVTEANPALGTESVTSAELGAEWSLLAPAASAPPLTLGATAFWNDLRDAVGNVTIARGPGTFPVVGTLAAGGLGRQRLNLDRIRAQGAELAATWRARRDLTFTAAALYTDHTVRRATVAPNLVGNRLAQVPRHVTTVGASWRGPGGLTVAPRVRWLGAQWEDDENTLRLAAAVVADLGVSYPLGRGLELFLNLENLGDARLETGRSADGVVNTGTPRLLLGGLRGAW